MSESSTKPYLIRAIHEWCCDNGFRPYVAVVVDEHTVVPREFVRNGEIVLNVSVDATNRLRLGNDMIEFEARFGGSARQVSIPVENVTAIYAAENGHGMAFEVPKAPALVPERPVTERPVQDQAPESAPAEPALEVVPSAPRGPSLVAPAADRTASAEGEAPGDPPSPPAPGGRPKLTRIK